MSFAELKSKVTELMEPCYTIYDFLDEKSVAEVANLAFGRYDNMNVTNYKISYLAPDIRYIEVEFA